MPSKEQHLASNFFSIASFIGFSWLLSHGQYAEAQEKKVLPYEMFCSVSIMPETVDAAAQAFISCYSQDAPELKPGAIDPTVEQEIDFIPSVEQTEEEWNASLSANGATLEKFDLKPLDLPEDVNKKYSCYTYVMMKFQEAYNVDFGITDQRWLREDGMNYFADVYMEEVSSGEVDTFSEDELEENDIILLYEEKDGLLLHSIFVDKESLKTYQLVWKDGVYHLVQGSVFETAKYFKAKYFRRLRKKKGMKIITDVTQ